MGFNETRMGTGRVTHEGAPAFSMNPAHELYLLVVSSLMSGDSFYESQEDRVERFQTLVRAVLLQGDEQFIVGLAAYARDQMYLRTTPTILAAELFIRGYEAAGAKAAEGAWLRGDEHLEALAYFKSVGAKRTKALLRAVARRLNAMDEYGFVKYASGNKSFTQRDAIRLSHPVPKDEVQSALFKYVVHGWDKLEAGEKSALPHIAKLKAGGTQSWEQHVSKHGSTAESWAEAIPKMGYMALLRNLRNIIEKSDVGMDVLKMVAEKLTNPALVAKSKQLPFRYLSAFRALPHDSPQVIYDAISVAADMAVRNVTDLDGETLVLVDTSASMNSPVSAKSKVTCANAGQCLGAILVHKGNAQLYAFGDVPVKIDAPSKTPVMATLGMMGGISRRTGHGTAIQRALVETLNERYKRVIILTDHQTRDNANATAVNWLNADKSRRMYIIDLRGYGLPNIDPRHPQLMLVGGFSDKVFEWVKAVEIDNPLRKIQEYAG